jgi:hypothetical protein
MARMAEKLVAGASAGRGRGGVVAATANKIAATNAPKTGPNFFMRFPLAKVTCCPPFSARSINAQAATAPSKFCSDKFGDG